MTAPKRVGSRCLWPQLPLGAPRCRASEKPGREDFVEEGGWAVIADKEYADAAEFCAERLITMEAPTTQEAVSTETGAIAQ